jgi:flavorubredoxin
MTAIAEIADGIYRINTPLEIPGAGGFSFNQYLIVDDAPLLFHTGLRRLFPHVREAISKVMPVERLRYIGISHFEADECGALNDFLAAAPSAEPVCSEIAAMVSINDFADRPARAMAEGGVLPLGRRRVRWLDAPHLPHGWECGYLFEEATATLLCGDLFTQGGAHTQPLIESDILGPSEAFRQPLDYYAHARGSRALFEKLAATNPATLACMHGSAWRGDGAALIRALADSVEGGSAVTS